MAKPDRDAPDAERPVMTLGSVPLTPYRDDREALQMRLGALTEELDGVRARTRELADLQKSEAELAREVESLRRQLDGMAARRALPLLESVKVASPCHADWDEMTGDDRSRFCGHCQKDVFNLSGMTRDEAEQFLRERTTSACVRVYRRADGTVLTSDCEVGARRVRRRKIAVAAAVGGGLIAAGAWMASRAAQTVMMGEMQAPPRSADVKPAPTDRGTVTMGEMTPEQFRDQELGGGAAPSAAPAAPEQKPPKPPKR